MFGDPLHFVVILANSAAWAWDIKYLIAKWLFAFGLGLCVLASESRSRIVPLASRAAGRAPHRRRRALRRIFVYRLNHPAFFSVCYAPWVLVTWLHFIAAPTRRSAAGWLAGLMIANWDAAQQRHRRRGLHAARPR